jgi:hypothetical protein
LSTKFFRMIDIILERTYKENIQTMNCKSEKTIILTIFHIVHHNESIPILFKSFFISIKKNIYIFQNKINSLFFFSIYRIMYGQLSSSIIPTLISLSFVFSFYTQIQYSTNYIPSHHLRRTLSQPLKYHSHYH